jgi:5-methylcytosine-specific restriction protein B
LIRDVASWKSLAIDDTAPLFDSFVYGIGDPGLVYNTGRPNELTYLARFSIEVIAKETGARTELLKYAEAPG